MARAATGIYRGVSAEHRRDERRRRLMDAALEIMGTQGWSATTVRGVCELAKVGPRFFYESFEDIDALAVAVLDEIVEDATTRMLDAVLAAPDDPAAKARTAIETIVTELTDDPRRTRVVFVEARGSEALMQRRFSAMRALAGLMAAQAHASFDFPPNADAFVDAVSLVFAGGIAELIIVWLDGGVEVSRDELIETCVALMVETGANAPAIATRLARGSRSKR